MKWLLGVVCIQLLKTWYKCDDEVMKIEGLMEFEKRAKAVTYICQSPLPITRSSILNSFLNDVPLHREIE